jgi:hypothetical protein
MTRSAVTLSLAVALVSAAIGACAPAAPRVFTQDAVVRVESDGAPVPGAEVLSSGKILSKTPDDGRVQLRMSGHDGDVFHVDVACPAGFRPSGSHEFDLLVRRSEDGRTPELTVRCLRLTRRALVAVRANNGGDLPVMFLGREVARTDSAGAATIVMDVSPGEDVELVLDTKGKKKMHPQNPVLSFRATEKDDVFVVDQTFTVDKPPAVAVARGPVVARSLSRAD